MLIAYKVPREEYKLLFKDSKMYNRFLNYIKTTHFSDWEDLYNRLDIRIVRDDKDKSIKYPIDEINSYKDDWVQVNGMAHITGGGLIENVPRTIPDGLCANIEKAKVKVSPQLFLL